MRNFFLVFYFFSFNFLVSQNLSLNHSNIESALRFKQLNGDFTKKFSFTIKPLNISKFRDSVNNYLGYKKIYNSNKFEFSLLPIDYFIELNSNYPYNRNNGSMIPNRGYQHICQQDFPN